MAGIEFLKPRLGGARFEGGNIPLDVLPELSALGRMVVDVAKARFMESHPDHKRLPPGFTGKVELKLATVENGSAIPVIHLVPTEPSLNGFSLPYQEFFEQARDDIVGVVASAVRAQESKEPVSLPLQRRYLGYFNVIGRGLRDGEWMELGAPGYGDGPRLTKESRLRILELSNLDITKEVILRGSVPAVDKSRKFFQIQPINGTKVTVPLQEPYKDTVLQAFDKYVGTTATGNALIMLQGVGRYDRINRLTALDSVAEVELLDPLDIAARLDVFRTIQEGWLDGEGIPFDDAGLDWLATRFDHHFPDDLPLPYALPTVEGEVRMEWDTPDSVIIMEIDLNTHQSSWLWFDPNSDDDEDGTINLDSQSDWEWMVGRIRDKLVMCDG